MIRHVVVWTVVGDTEEEKKRAFAVLKPELEALPGVIPGLLTLQLEYSTGPNPKNWDMCLISDHESWDALEEYMQHPAHLAAAAKVNERVTARAGADFEI